MKIKDVIYGEIIIKEQVIEDLIQTIEFQRLRKIKQLGITNYTFPGAEHTRYVHSIGVYYILSLILEDFKRKEQVFFNEEEEMAIKVAGLLHDLGHGPLSHTAEMFFGYSHEDYSIKIIEHEKTDVYKILKKYDEENSSNIFDKVINIIKKTYKNEALVSLLSSSVDADRLDYLVRDSYYTGTVYGNIDVQRIISSMKYHKGKIVFDKKCIPTLEDFILSRYHMFTQVYLNEKSIIYERLIQKILDRVFVLYSKGYDFNTDISLLFDMIEKPILVENYLKINDYNFLELIESFYYEDDKELSILSSYLLRRVNFYEETDKEAIDTNDEIVLRVDNFQKKVYSKKEIIYILDNDEIIPIEDVSQIFDFIDTKLLIEVKAMNFKVKKLW